MNRAEDAAIARAKRAEKIPSLHERFWSKVDIRSDRECWPWTAAVRRKNEGYGAFWYQGRHIPATRMALKLNGIDVPDGMEVCHSCDNPNCCNPSHLFVGTRQENNADKVSKGRHARMEKTGTAKVDRGVVISIRNEVRALRAINGRKFGAKNLAAKYGITLSCLSDIIYHRSWREI